MTIDQTHARPPLAVVGVSALFPGSVDSTGFWTDILRGTDRMSDVPSSHWLIEDHYDGDMTAPDKTYGRRGGFIDPIAFDAMAFGIPPTVVPSTDTAQLLALIVAQRVLDDAITGDFSDVERARTSVILGVTSGQELLGAMASRMSRPIWLQGMRRAGVPEDVAVQACEQISDLHPEWTESTFPGLLGNVVAGRIANRLDLGGTNCVTDAACASSFSALSMAANELYLGDSDLVIAGGVDTMNDIFMYMCFSKTPALSKSEDIRPFSDQADGTMLGEGIGMVALKRLADAERDGNNIYCVLNGVGSSSDGRSKSVYAPVSSGQARALDDAYAKAGYGPDTVELVEAHGTGTVAGDAAEFGGLELAFGQPGRSAPWCALGSVKSQIGHTKAAAGAAGLVKVIMGLHHNVLPQTAKIEQPNPQLDLETSPFYLNTRSRPWVRSRDHERRGSVSSFGFGGSNFHVALSEYTGDGVRAARLRPDQPELVILCGTDGADVVRQATECRHQAGLDTAAGDRYLQWLSATTTRTYDSSAHARLAVLAESEAELVAKLDEAITMITKQPDAAFSTPGRTHYGVGPAMGEVGFLFPGQGSQYLFMGDELAMSYRAGLAPWDVAADLDWPDAPLHDVVFPRRSFADGAEQAQLDRLTETQSAQPAIGAASLGLLEMLRSIDVEARAVGGHSFGEVIALQAAGVLSTTDALRVAARRGVLMAEAAVAPGAMTAVARTIDDVRSIVESSGLDVVVANHNTPTQVVLSGPTESIEAVEVLLADADITAKRLPVATAFHSPVVSDASGAFSAFLEDIEVAAPTVPVLANETAAPYPSDPAAIRGQLGRQLANPVRFVEMVEAMYDAGIRVFVEVGPSSVLSGLVKKILKGRDHTMVSLDNKKGSSLGAFFGGVGQLAAAGVSMHLDALWADHRTPVNPAERTRPKLAIPLNGANSGAPYPPNNPDELVGPNAAAAPSPNGASPQPVLDLTTTEPTISAPQPSASTPSPAPMTQNAPVTVPSSPAPAPPVSPAVASAPAAPVAPPVVPGVLGAYQAVQEQTARAHAEYMATMAQVHSAFLATSQQSIALLGQLAAGAVPAPAMPAAPVVPVVPVPAPAMPAAPVVQADPVVVAPAPVVAAPAAAPVAASPVAAPAAAPVAASPVAAPVVAAEPVVGGLSDEGLMALLLGVVADKTGYPSEMLSMEMELEGDLGIDSIKRVEILSAMQDEVPSLPEVDTGVMAELVTLGQIVEYMAGQMEAASPVAAPAPAAVAASPGAASAVAAAPVVGGLSDEGLMALLLGVVADKTGYPSEMLSMEMELEGDLGIDSIKRVEILSAMQDEVPSLPEVDTGVMAELVTLGQIVEYMAGQMEAAPASAEPTPAMAGAAVDRFTLEAVPAPKAGAPKTGLTDGTILVTNDHTGVAPAVVASLQQHGLDAGVVDHVPASGAPNVIFLGGLKPFASIDDAVGVNREAFDAARTFAAAPAAAGTFVTVSDLGGSFGLGATAIGENGHAFSAWSAGLSGLAKTAALEWPDVTVRALDIERGQRDAEAVAAALVDELITGGEDLEIGLSATGDRVTLSSHPIGVEHGALALGADDVIVVSGGGRGVTATTMIELAAASKATFVLLGRSALAEEPAAARGALTDAELKRALLDDAKASGHAVTPAELSARVARILANREINATVAAIWEAGGRAVYRSVDITSSAAVTDALDRARAEWGPITGLVHGAGVLADKRIADKTDEQFDRVFNTKVAGLRVLLDATRSDDLRLLCLFSSVAARTGNNGQSDYAMANEVLNKVASAERQRRGDRCVVKALGWGPWEGGMVTPALKAHFASMGVDLIPLDAGAKSLVAELASPQRNHVEIVLGGGVLAAASHSNA